MIFRLISLFWALHKNLKESKFPEGNFCNGHSQKHIEKIQNRFLATFPVHPIQAFLKLVNKRLTKKAHSSASGKARSFLRPKMDSPQNFTYYTCLPSI